MILGLTAMAVPASAATTCVAATVTLNTTCESAVATYTIAYNASGAPVTLLPGDLVSVDFAAGTNLTAVTASDVTFVIPALPAVTTIAKSDTHIDITIPGATMIAAGDPVTITIAKVKNPAVAGNKSLSLDYKQTCCPAVVFGCADYVITPKYSTYGFVWDSGPTYPGIAVGFIPPFKACGQDPADTGALGGFNIGVISSASMKWLNAFDLLLKPTLVGCFGPCTLAVNVTMNLTAKPTGANVTLSLNETGGYDPAKIKDLSPQKLVELGTFVLGANTTVTWSNAIHFDTVGDYQICVEAWCPPGAASCELGCDPEGFVVASKCFDIKVYQWKEACKIPLYRKWNLISLPLVPLEENMPIANVLAAAANASLIKSIHYYDRCADTWSVYGNGQTSLSTLEDGKAYWVKVDYTLGSATKGPGLPIGDLWVWGTTKPVPPDGPSAYQVCDGWNMIGYTEGCPTTMWDDDYLWNFFDFWSVPLYGAVYGWNPTSPNAQTWDTAFQPYGVTMTPGKGYWVSFGVDGFVYPP